MVRRCFGLLVATVACGGTAEPRAADVATAPAHVAEPTDAGAPRAEADPLLASARASLRAGVLDPELLGAILGSDEPGHARARELLSMLADDTPPPEAPDSDGSEAGFDVPALKLATPPPQDADADADADPPAARAGVVVPRPARPTPASAHPAAAKPKPTPTLRKVALRSTAKGAALTLRGGRGLVVGVVNQPRSGIVRLVVEAGASAEALAARPRITGAKVTSIRRTGKTVFVTLSLDPGWSLAGIVKTKAGAQVNLRRGAS